MRAAVCISCTKQSKRIYWCNPNLVSKQIVLSMTSVRKQTGLSGPGVAAVGLTMLFWPVAGKGTPVHCSVSPGVLVGGVLELCVIESKRAESERLTSVKRFLRSAGAVVAGVSRENSRGEHVRNGVFCCSITWHMTIAPSRCATVRYSPRPCVI